MFIIGIKEHSQFGYIAGAYWIEKHNEEFFKFKQTIVYEDIKSFELKLSEEQKQILTLIDQYSDTNIFKFFSKNKKILTTQFFLSLTPEFIDKKIRPFIEKRLRKIFEIIKNSHETKVFHKPDYFENIYIEDEIIVEEKFAEAVFNFHRTEEEIRYFLTVRHNKSEINLKDKVEIILSLDPCIIVLNNSLYFFKDIDAKKLLPFFTKEYISVAKRMEKKYFETFVLKAVKNFRVNAKGFEIINYNPVKKLLVFLEYALDGKIVVVPKFSYDKNLYFYSSKNLVRVEMFEKNGQYSFTKFKRDTDWEGRQIDYLKSLNLKFVAENLMSHKNDHENVAIQNEQMQKWIYENYENLKINGIEIVQNFSDKKYYFGKPKIELKVNQKIDWFNIHAKVSFGEFEVSFWELREYILDEKNEIELPNGEIALIPAEWFTKYKNILTLSEAKNDEIKIQKVHLLTIENEEFAPFKRGKLKKLIDFFAEKKHEEIVSPEILQAELREYQKKGFEWLNALQINSFGGCLADDMGLGKTIQTLAILASVSEKNQSSQNTIQDKKISQLDLFSVPVVNRETSLIVMPKSLIHNWKNEIKKFLPNFKVLEYSGADREKLQRQINFYDIILTSYGLLRNDIDFFKTITFSYVVLDESQNIKNSKSKIYKAVIKLKAKNKITLTGTPIENSLKDLWSQMNFLNQGLLGSEKFFQEKFITPIEKGGDENQGETLKKIIRPFILRRTKTEVLSDLPPLVEQTVFCEMSKEQRQIYEQENSKVRNKILELTENNEMKKSSIYILQAINKLRQIANHPQMLDENPQNSSGKFDEVISRLETLISGGHKVLIFSSYVKHLKIFEKYFKRNKLQYSMLTGATQNREKVIADFQNNDKNQLFLISIKAGGVGLNLTSASYVFILDPWWNPAIENQAISRSHRLGQTSNVMVYRFISEETVEEKIRKLQMHKKQLADELIETSNLFKHLSEKNIVDLF